MIKKRSFTPWVAVLMVIFLVIGIWKQVRGPAAIPPEQGRIFPELMVVPSFELVNQYGDTITTLPKQWHVWFVGYTECPDICPLTVTRIEHTLALLQDDTRFVFVSANPVHDTPAVLKAFLAQYTLPNAEGLTGEPTGVNAFIRQLGLHAAPLTGSKEWAHSAQLLLSNPEGQIVGIFSQEMTPEDMAREIEVFQKKRL
jgi:protein SCO1/2